jgi:hypothetical protein
MEGGMDAVSIFGPVGWWIVRASLIAAILLLLVALVIWVARLIVPGTFAFRLRRKAPPRLALVDALPIDSRRRLVLVRRDQFEHLILIGGETDLVVEDVIFRGLPLNARVRADQLRGAAAPAEPAAPPPAPLKPEPAIASAPPAPPRPPQRTPAPSGPAQPPPFLRRNEAPPKAEPRRLPPEPLSVPPEPLAPPRVEPSMAGQQPPQRVVDPALRATNESRFRSIEVAPTPRKFGDGPAPLPQSSFPPPITSRATPVARRPEAPPAPKPRDEAVPSPEIDAAVAEPPAARRPMVEPEEKPAGADTENGASQASQISSLEQEMARLLGEISGKKP